MIKKFEQFINESYQSSKLKQLIKQHGQLKCAPKRLLYDIMDDDIIDVVDSIRDYYLKYGINSENWDNNDLNFGLELEDGTCIVIGDLNIAREYFSDGHFNYDMLVRKYMDERHSERHKGNLGSDGGDDIHDKHLKNVDKLKSKKLAREFDEDSIDEIVNEVQHLMYNKSKEKQSDDCYFEWSVGGKDGYLSTHYALSVGSNNVTRLHLHYTMEYSEIKNSDDEYDYCDEYLTLNSFSLSVKTADNESVIVESEDLGVTKETYKYLFKRYIRRNMRCMTEETSERRFGKFKTR